MRYSGFNVVDTARPVVTSHNFVTCITLTGVSDVMLETKLDARTWATHDCTLSNEWYKCASAAHCCQPATSSHSAYGLSANRIWMAPCTMYTVSLMLVWLIYGVQAIEMDIKLSNSAAQFDGLKYEGKVPCFKVSIELAIASNSRFAFWKTDDIIMWWDW